MRVRVRVRVTIVATVWEDLEREWDSIQVLWVELQGRDCESGCGWFGCTGGLGHQDRMGLRGMQDLRACVCDVGDCLWPWAFQGSDFVPDVQTQTEWVLAFSHEP